MKTKPWVVRVYGEVWYKTAEENAAAWVPQDSRVVNVDFRRTARTMA